MAHEALSAESIEQFKSEIGKIHRTLDTYEQFMLMVRNKILSHDSHQIKHQIKQAGDLISEKLKNNSTPDDVKTYIFKRLELVEDPQDDKAKSDLAALLKTYGMEKESPRSLSPREFLARLGSKVGELILSPRRKTSAPSVSDDDALDSVGVTTSRAKEGLRKG